MMGLDMPILCREHNLLFLMAPATGCTALGEALIQNLGGEWLPRENIHDERGFIEVDSKHATLDELIEHGCLDRDEAARLTVFTTVRNPYDAMVSYYFKKRAYRDLIDDPESFVHRIPGWIDEIAACQAMSFSRWVNRKHLRQAIKYARKRRKGSLFRQFTKDADVVLRHETLQADFDNLLRSVGIARSITIPTIGVTKEKLGYQRYYTPLSRFTVKHLFGADFADYGYRL